MIEDEVPQAVGSQFGHNSGSMLVEAKSALAEALHDTVRDGGRTFAQRKAEFLASAAKQKVVDRRTAADAADTIKMAGEVWAMIDQQRRALSDPFREVHLTLSGEATEFWYVVTEAMTGLREQIDAWSEEEDKRIAQQRAEQQADLARLRAGNLSEVGLKTERQHIDYSAPAPAPTTMATMREPKRATIRGDLGATISPKDIAGYEIEDISLIPDHIMQSETVKQAILTVVRQTAKHFGVPAGIRVSTTTGNQIR